MKVQFKVSFLVLMMLIASITQTHGGEPKLNGEFYIITPPRWGPTPPDKITFHLNPNGAKDKDGNPIPFETLKACLLRQLMN